MNKSFVFLPLLLCLGCSNAETPGLRRLLDGVTVQEYTNQAGDKCIIATLEQTTHALSMQCSFHNK